VLTYKGLLLSRKRFALPHRCASKKVADASNGLKFVVPQVREKTFMSRRKSLIDSQYEALLFAKSAEVAREAAIELVRIVLGEETLSRPLEQALRECCRILRPAKDPGEQLRFEEEFLELAIWPGTSHKVAA
jgi:hypothetical protein